MLGLEFNSLLEVVGAWTTCTTPPTPRHCASPGQYNRVVCTVRSLTPSAAGGNAAVIAWGTRAACRVEARKRHHLLRVGERGPSGGPPGGRGRAPPGRGAGTAAEGAPARAEPRPAPPAASRACPPP